MQVYFRINAGENRRKTFWENLQLFAFRVLRTLRTLLVRDHHTQLPPKSQVILTKTAQDMRGIEYPFSSILCILYFRLVSYRFLETNKDL